MIQLRSAEQLEKATERARAGKLFVQPTTMFRQYLTFTHKFVSPLFSMTGVFNRKLQNADFIEKKAH